MSWKLILAAAALAAGPALADNHPTASVGATVSEEARERGTLHPGHVAVYATGRGNPADGKFNKPADAYHQEPAAPGYPGGPGGWATTRGNRN